MSFHRLLVGFISVNTWIALILYLLVPSNLEACSCGSKNNWVMKKYQEMDWIFWGRVEGFEKCYMFPVLHPELVEKFPDINHNLKEILEKNPH